MGELSGDRFAEVEVTSAVQLHNWLEHHHTQADGIWLITYKKAVPSKYVTHDDVLDALVAYGWCDGGARRIDNERTMQQISPRRTQPWAKTYKDRAERLTAEGLMHPTALRGVEQAKTDGTWDAMNDVDALKVPGDLSSALDNHPPAAERFAEFPPSTRRNILWWIASARTDQTRQRRISAVARDASGGIRTKTNG